MNTIQRGIVTLLRSAVTGEKLTLPEGFALEDADEIIRRQSLLPLAFQGAYHCGISTELPIMQQYRTKYLKYILINERQMRAVEALFRAFEENGIDYLPLKGVNMKARFPSPELRTMGDADVLIRNEQYGNIVPILEKQGYRLADEEMQVDTWDSDNLHLEMHHYIVHPKSRYSAYYGDGWKFAVKDSGCRYKMSAEDEFIFIFAHFARHYRIGGIGCRHVLDLFVCNRVFPELNQQYIEAELEKLNLLQFYRNMKQVLAVWFEDAEPDAMTDLITDFIFSGGTFGSAKNRAYYFEVMGIIKAQQASNTRMKMMWQTAFPPLSYMRRQYPILWKAPVLLPVLWVLRWLRVLLFAPKRLVRKAKMLNEMTDDEVEFRREALKVMGIAFDTKEDVR